MVHAVRKSLETNSKRRIKVCIDNLAPAMSLPMARSRWNAAFMIAAMGLLLTLPERAEAQQNLRLASGEIGDTHHALGVGLMSLVKVTLLHEQDIDLSLLEEVDPVRRVDLVKAGEAELALLSEGNSVALSAGYSLGLVSQFKLQDKDGALKETINLVASNDMDPALIQHLARAIVEEERWLSGALPGLSRLAPDQSESAGIFWHTGALAYYTTLYPDLATTKEPVGRPQIFLVYLDGRTASLDDTAKRQIDLACSYAVEYGAVRVIVNGPADMMSLDASGLQFSDAQAQTALAELRTRDGCRDVVIVQEPDGKTFTERYDPAVPVTGQRRIEVGVILGR